MLGLAALSLPPGKTSWCSPSLGDMGDKSCRVSVMGGTQHQPSPGDSRAQGGSPPCTPAPQGPHNSTDTQGATHGQMLFTGGRHKLGSSGTSPNPPTAPQHRSPLGTGAEASISPPWTRKDMPSAAVPSQQGRDRFILQITAGQWPLAPPRCPHPHRVPTTTPSPPRRGQQSREIKPRVTRARGSAVAVDGRAVPMQQTLPFGATALVPAPAQPGKQRPVQPVVQSSPRQQHPEPQNL